MPPPAETEVLRANNQKWAWVFLSSVAFVVVGAVVVSRPHSGFDGVMGWASVSFFGLCAFVALLVSLPGASFLRLSPEGLTVRSLWRTSSYRWSDIEEFGVGHAGTRLVCFNFSPGYVGQESVRALNRGLTGFDAALPDNYGREHAELAEHLNRWRERHVGRASTA